jgi:Cys-tRNA(Pro)/Cys-tRNA(Cys) deacylase
MAVSKTNAVRIVEAHHIAYQLKTYDAPDGFLNGVSVAEQVGMPVELVYKTLVTQGASREYYVCVIPAAEELDLKKAAKHFGEKKLEMIPAKDITKVTGYIKGGCSPVGMKKRYTTAIADSAPSKERIAVSGGLVGLQMELPVSSLIELTGAAVADLTVKDTD